VKLAAKIAELAGGNLSHVFFNSSGSEANDTVFRMVRHYWTLKGQPQRSIFISRWNAYHGTGVAGVSLGGMKAMHAQGGLPIPGVEHVMQPYKLNEGLPGESDADFCARAAQAIEERILEVGPENVAAFIGEPVQGAGGVIIPPAGYWQKVEAICRKYGILLVCDEVITGFGRTGQPFAAQTFGVVPDMITCAKGLTSGYLPLGALILSDRIWAAMAQGGHRWFTSGLTYSGHPVSCAAALKNIEILDREGLLANAASVGAYFNTRLKTLESLPLVGDVRGQGLMLCVENVANKASKALLPDEANESKRISDVAESLGLLVRPIGHLNVMSPPLTITKTQVDFVVEVLASAIRKVTDELVREGHRIG